MLFKCLHKQIWRAFLFPSFYYTFKVTPQTKIKTNKKKQWTWKQEVKPVGV